MKFIAFYGREGIDMRWNLFIRSIYKVCLPGSFLASVILVILVQDAEAIPSFSRKYETSCATCHEAYPRLNAVGEAYRLNGYKFADDELYIKDEPVELGDEAYKRVWPGAIWPGHIPGMPPIAVVLDNDFRADIGSKETKRSEFLTPRMAKILAAGDFGENVSGFIELSFERQGAGSAGHHGGAAIAEGVETDVAGWVHFEDLLVENLFNLRVGLIGMHEIGLFTHRGHNRFSISDYFYGATIPSLSGHNVAFATTGDEDADVDFSGNPFSLHAQPGIELNGFSRRFRYAFGVTNGNGTKFNDNNNEKDTYLQLAYKLGGMGFDGTGMSEDEDLDAASDPWRDDSFTFSFFGYYGNAQVDTSEDFESEQTDRFWRIGPGVLWRKADLQLGAGYIFGKNDNPFGAVSTGSVDTRSWFAEANYFVTPWIIPYFRYEALEYSNLPPEVTTEDEASFPEGLDQTRFVVGTKMLIRANISFGVEGVFYTKDQREHHADENNLLIASLKLAF